MLIRVCFWHVVRKIHTLGSGSAPPAPLSARSHSRGERVASLQQGADLGPAAVAAEVFLLHWVSVFFHSLIESLFGGSHVVASSQCMFSLSVWKLACFMLPNWTDWYPWSVTFAWWQYRPWIITWKKGQCAMITNSKNSVKAFLDPGIHLNVTLAQELICLGEWLSTLSHSKSAALH